MNVYDLAEVRAAIADVIDDGDPKYPENRSWYFFDTDDPAHIEARMRFLDAVQELLVRRMIPIKGEIKAIGTFDEEGRPVGWTFGKCRAAIDVTDKGILYAGYSVEELRAKAAGNGTEVSD